MTEEAYPLQWPNGRGRTEDNKRVGSGFDVTPERAQREMVNEIKRMRGQNIIVSSNLRRRNDGGLYYNEINRVIDDPGIAVYFTRKGQRVCFCCDKYRRVWENMRAIGKTIEAMRGIERWGSTEMLDQAFTGFTALPSPDHKKTWREVMGVRDGASPTLERLSDRFRALAKRRHPDSPTGSTQKFQELKAAFDEGKRALGYEEA